MKNNFYHSSVEIKEYPFDKVYLEELNDEIIENIKLFNSSNNKIFKQEISKYIPISFPKCRICNKEIINSNFHILFNVNEKYIQIIKPSIYCREINENKYYLSCCEDCLLEHFKNCPPRAPKYYFMKANKYGQYSFGYSNEEYHKICSMTVGVTLKSMINKWGKDLGEQKWKEYCDKQAQTNSYEYKKKKYGWSKEQFNQFNKSRAITLENLQNKYGDELGKQYFEDYVNLQRITKSKKYMLEKYGELHTKEINASKAQTLENYTKRLGNEEGLRQFEIMLSHHKNYFSKISQKFFNEIDEFISKKYKTYYATKNCEYGINLSNKYYIRLDYFILELNLCIEFNGTYYHADPRIFKPNDYPNPHNKILTAKEIWEKDKQRYQLLKDIKDIETVVVWENDYRNGNINIIDFIKNVLKIEI